MLLPISTTSPLADELVAARMPSALLVVLIAFSLSHSHVTCTQSVLYKVTLHMH
jgi:hypothetical protein